MSIKRKRMLTFAFFLMMLGVMLKLSAVQVEASAYISSSSLLLQKGKTSTLKVVGIKKSGTVSWKTSDSSVAAFVSVEKNRCTVKAFRTGTAVITAKYGKKKMTCRITVKTAAGIRKIHLEEEKKLKKDIEDNIIWFGDSRSMFMGIYLYGYYRNGQTVMGEHVVSMDGAMYTWAGFSGYQELASRLRNDKDAVVICGFGVNDAANGLDFREAYLSLLSRLHKSFPNARICIMSVNPIRANAASVYAKTESAAQTLTQRILAYNSYFKQNCPDWLTYIDTYSHVQFNYVDGIHYDVATYARIRTYVIDYLVKVFS